VQVDQRAASVGRQHGCECLRDAQRAERHDPEDAPDLFLVVLQERSEGHDAGVVDDDRDVTGGTRELGGGMRVRQLELERDDPRVVLDHGLARGDVHLRGPGPQKLLHDLLAQSSLSARDQDGRSTDSGHSALLERRRRIRRM
jgi:hypothetical protein